MNTPPKKIFLNFILPSIITILCFSAILLTLSNIYHTNFVLFFKKIISGLYLPDKNLFKINKINNINIYLYIYLTFALSLLIGYLLKKITFKEISIIKPCLITTTILIISLQTIHHATQFSQEHTLFQHKTLKEKIRTRFKNSYAFAKYCQKHLPGKHYGKTITDIDIQTTKSMLTFMATSYYLYPIDIRRSQNNSIDSLIIFLKNNPLSSVPENFTAMKPFDKRSLIAVKNNL